MAIENVTPEPAELPGQALQPHEYLQWLLSLERASGLPDGARAYLVSIDWTGMRRLTPVGEHDAVINLRGGLAKWVMTADLLSTDLLQEVRAACAERLAERGIKTEPSDKERSYARASLSDADEQLQSLGRQVRAIASAIERLLPADPFRHPLLNAGPSEQRLELRDGITAVRDLAITLHNIGSSIKDTVPDELNEALKAMCLGLLPSYQTEVASHD